ALLLDGMLAASLLNNHICCTVAAELPGPRVFLFAVELADDSRVLPAEVSAGVSASVQPDLVLKRRDLESQLGNDHPGQRFTGGFRQSIGEGESGVPAGARSPTGEAVQPRREGLRVIVEVSAMPACQHS